MPSEYTPNLGFEQQETGENINTWGERLNNALALIEDAIAGVASIPLSANLTLSNTLNVPNQSRKAILLFTDGPGLAADPTVTVQLISKSYYVENRLSARPITFTNGTASVTMPAGRKAFLICNGSALSIADWVADVATLKAAAEAARDITLGARDQAQTAASNAGSAASTAAGHASAASTARAAAEAALDSFDDRYLGAKSSAPTVDNDGNALIVGAVYFDTTLGQMRAWSGAAWQAFVPAAADYLLKSGGTMAGSITFSASQYASQAAAEAGNATVGVMSPQRVAQAVAAQVPASGLAFISQQTVTTPVASVDFTGLTGAYDEYLLEILNAVPTATSILNLRTSSNGGVAFDAGASDYKFTNILGSPTDVTPGGAGAASRININGGAPISTSGVLGGASGSVRIVRPASTSEHTHFMYTGESAAASNGLITLLNGAGARLSADDVDAVRLFFETGNIASGSFKLYGLRKS